MNLDVVGQVSWIPVIVGAIVYFALGAAWFSPLVLGRAWQRSIGWDASREPPRMTPVSMLAPFAAYLVAAAATGILAVATASDTLGEGLVLGLVVGLGFAATATAVDAAFDPDRPQPWVWFAITAAYHVLGLLIVGVLVSVWR
jgi:Protein of unknown function (DUF1761)